jgi:hypothetical protein
VTDRPVSPKDLLATVYHLLGYAPDTIVYDKTNRPHPVLSEGAVVREVLA